MTVALTTTPLKLEPINGAASVIIKNTTAVDVEITQRFVVPGSTEEETPEDDPGYALPAGATIVLPFGQPIWLATASSTGDVSVTPWAS